MNSTARQFLSSVRSALGSADPAAGAVTFSGQEALASVYAVTDLAAASIGAACLAMAELAEAGPTVVDRRLASLWFGWSIAPQGWEMPPVWDAVAGDYRAEDGWIRLHTNAPHHRAAALSVLDTPNDREAVATVVARWRKDELESRMWKRAAAPPRCGPLGTGGRTPRAPRWPGNR